MSQHKIPNTTGSLMLSVALGFDAAAAILNLIPLVGTLLAIVVSATGIATMWLWFAIKGVVIFRRPRRLVAAAITATIEVLPIVNVLPACTFWTWRTILSTRIKEQTKTEGTMSTRRILREGRRAKRRREREEERSERQQEHS